MFLYIGIKVLPPPLIAFSRPQFLDLLKSYYAYCFQNVLATLFPLNFRIMYQYCIISNKPPILIKPQHMSKVTLRTESKAAIAFSILRNGSETLSHIALSCI